MLKRTANHLVAYYQELYDSTQSFINKEKMKVPFVYFKRFYS